MQNGEHFKENINCSPIISSLLTFTASHNFMIMKCDKHRIFFLSLFFVLLFFKTTFKGCYSQPLKLTNHLKVCQDKWSSWPVSVCWPAVILSPTTVIFILHYLYAQLPHLNKLRVAFFPYHEDPVIPLKVLNDFWWTARFFLKLTLYFLVINKGKIWLWIKSLTPCTCYTILFCIQ